MGAAKEGKVIFEMGADGRSKDAMLRTKSLLETIQWLVNFSKFVSLL